VSSKSRGSLTIAQALSLLEATPTRLAALTENLTLAQLRMAPAPDEWSANDILAHLRACADMWGKYIMAILAEDEPTLRAINPRTWIEQTNYRELDFQTSLRAFATQRAELLATLKPLPVEGWSRSATITGAGRPLTLTVLSYTQRLARHERPHVKQIERIGATFTALSQS